MPSNVDLSSFPTQPKPSVDLSSFPTQPMSKADLSSFPTQPQAGTLERKSLRYPWHLSAMRLGAEKKQGPITTGFFGTPFGEASMALAAAREPAIRAREGLRKFTELIPEPKTTSPTMNFILGTPKAIAEIGTEFSAGMIEPESLATLGVSGALAPVRRAGVWG